MRGHRKLNHPTRAPYLLQFFIHSDCDRLGSSQFTGPDDDAAEVAIISMSLTTTGHRCRIRATTSSPNGARAYIGMPSRTMRW